MSTRQNNTNNGNNPPTITCIVLRYKDGVRGIHILSMTISVGEQWRCEKSCGKKVKARRGKRKTAYLSYRTVIGKKGGNFAK